MLKSFGCAAVLVATTQAYAQVSVSPSTNVTVTQVGGIWQIVFSSAASGSYTISGGPATDTIEHIQSAATGTINLTIGSSIQNLWELRRTSGSGTLNVQALTVTGRLGPSITPTANQVIRASNFNSVISVGGDVSTSIATYGSSSTFVGVAVDGNLNGDIINSFGEIGSILVGGDIQGTPSDPVDIYARDGITDVAANQGLDVTGHALDVYIGNRSSPLSTPTMWVGQANIGGDLKGTVRVAFVGESFVDTNPASDFTRFTIGRDLEGTFEVTDGLGLNLPGGCGKTLAATATTDSQHSGTSCTFGEPSNQARSFRFPHLCCVPKLLSTVTFIPVLIGWVQ